jgi:Uma2 family endonuclease
MSKVAGSEVGVARLDTAAAGFDQGRGVVFAREKWTSEVAFAAASVCRTDRRKNDEISHRENVALARQAHENKKPSRPEPSAMKILKRDTHYHTYADYLTWSATYGDELINGAAYVREPPSPSPSHQVVVGEIHRQVANALKGKPCRVFVAPFDIRLPRSTEEDDQVDTVVQPDLFITCDLQKIDARGMRGAPEWIAEVLSPGTVRHDRKVKLPVYERAGVREVWFVDLIKRTLAVYRLEGGHYASEAALGLEGQTPLTAVSGVAIDWDQVLAEISWIKQTENSRGRG